MSGECMYYRWNAGYYCALKYDKNGNGDISDYEVHHYCWDGRYEDCPLYKNRNGSDGCFLTSACVEAMGLPDDCHELAVLRAFRDSYLASQPNGQQEICEYYQIAPKIVEQIKASGNAQSVFLEIYENLIVPCVQLIEDGNNKNAHKLYHETVLRLKIDYIGG